MVNRRILIIPPNDLLRHPIPNRMYHIAKQLSRKYDITIFSYPNHPLSNGVLRELHANELGYKTFRVKDLGIYYVVNAPHMMSAMKHSIKEVDVVIHANVLPSVIAAKLAKKYGKTVIYDYVDHFPQSASAYYRGITKKLVEKFVTLTVLQAIKDSTAIVTPSFGLASLIRGYADKLVYIIPNGVDPNLFKPKDVGLARKEVGIDYDGTIILLYGSIDTWLEIEPLLHTIKRLKDVRLMVVGYSHGKYYYRQLESLIRRLDIEDRIFRRPPQPYEKMPLFVNASNIIVAPFSRGMISYATPLKIIESLACARPVVTTNISEFKLWFKKGVFYYSSSREIYELLDSLVKEFDSVQRQLLSYSEVIRSLYSWESIAEAYRRVIEGEPHAVSGNWHKT
ncbi:MAG: glycosyltransferase [Ignisphaera sp.]